MSRSHYCRLSIIPHSADAPQPGLQTQAGLYLFHQNYQYLPTLLLASSSQPQIESIYFTIMHFPRMATSNSAIALATLLALILSAFYWPYPSPQPGHVVERSGYEEIDDFAGNSTFHSLASRAPPAYTPENYFNFINFENAFVKAADGSDFSMKDDYEKKVKQSILEMYYFLVQTFAVLEPHLDRRRIVQPTNPIVPSLL